VGRLVQSQHAKPGVLPIRLAPGSELTGVNVEVVGSVCREGGLGGRRLGSRHPSGARKQPRLPAEARPTVGLGRPGRRGRKKRRGLRWVHDHPQLLGRGLLVHVSERFPQRGDLAVEGLA
jgi:hypothetical protein